MSKRWEKHLTNNPQEQTFSVATAAQPKTPSRAVEPSLHGASSVLLLYPKRRLAHPKNYLLSLSIKYFLDQSIRKIFYLILKTEALSIILCHLQQDMNWLWHDVSVERPSYKENSKEDIVHRAAWQSNSCRLPPWTAVLLFSKLDKMFFGYAGTGNYFLDNENKYFLGWPNRRFGWIGNNGEQTWCHSVMYFKGNLRLEHRTTTGECTCLRFASVWILKDSTEE